MQTLVCSQPGHLQLEQREIPVALPGQAIVKIRRVGICGTDLHGFEGTQPFFQYPRILGHELAGDLVSADGAPGFVPGEGVTILPYFSCGICAACKKGKPNCCVQIQVCGVHIDGGMREYFAVPCQYLVHGRGLSMDLLAWVEPLAIGAHAVRRSEVLAGQTALVFGLGPIGLATVAFAQMAGAEVLGVDLEKSRVDLAVRRLQIPWGLDGRSAGLLENVREITEGQMPDIVFDCTGNLKAIEGAFPFISHGGRMVLVGLQREQIRFSHPAFHQREATLLSSRNATRADFESVLDVLTAGKINPIPFITHRCRLAEAPQQFPGWLAPASGIVKAMIQLDENN